MPVDLSGCLVVGISSRALFDLSHEDALFRNEGLDAYRAYQAEHEDQLLEPGTGFPLVKALLRLNEILPGERKIEVVIMSRNSSETSIRLFKSIDHYGLDITRAALTGGASITPYLKAFKVDLFLSQHEDDVQAGINSGIASALLYNRPGCGTTDCDQIRIAFDGDAVLFSDESERIFQEHGLAAFDRHEAENAHLPLQEGPFARLLKSLAAIQKLSGSVSLIRTALVTARSRPAHERVIWTLRAWDVVVDEVFFLGGMKKVEILEAFHPHIFFDDQEHHCTSASTVVPVGRIPYAAKESGE